MRLATLALLLAGTASVAAQPQSLVDQFQRRSLEARGLTMSYGLFVPENYDPEVDYPLVMAFHGLGESGTSLVNLERHRLATAWADPAVQAEYPAFVLAPQTLVGRRWTSDQDPDASDYTTVELVALDILAAVEAEFSIDPDRIYAVGLSLGGHATWDVVSRDPDRFAAAVPMSGRGFTSQADDLGDLPVWAFTGETDTVVPASQTRRLVQAMEDLGRQVVYTDCRRSPVDARAFDCPGTVSQDSLAEAIAAHADLIYTSERTTGHGPWAPWFDRPLLADWLFSKVRLDADAVAITAPEAGAAWTGTQSVTWTSARDASEVVEVWLSRNDGDDWAKVGEATVGDGSVALDVSAVADTPLARIRLIVLDANGRVVGREVSAPFRVDNAGNTAPTLRLDDEALRFAPSLTAETFDLPVVAADPEGEALTATVRYSVDGGATFADVETIPLAPSPAPQTIRLEAASLPNSVAAVVRVDLSDGTRTVSGQTAPFAKLTPRDENFSAEQVEGEGTGTVVLHFIDEAALTDHRYRITIDAADPEAKTYTVVDLDESETVLAGVPLSDGTQESPLFDGMALIVQDLAEGAADESATGWTEGDTDLGVAVEGGSVRISILTIPLLATEDDYTIRITDTVVGTSVARFTIPAQDLRFEVTAASDDAVRSVVFDDQNDDGLPGAGDVLYIQEPDADGDLQFAWALTFSAGTVAPEAGDAFTLVPLRSLGTGDAFEFTARFGIATEAGPAAADLVALYPNPFAGRLTVEARLGAPGEARVEVFDTLGRRVATLHDGPAPAGTLRTEWDGEAASGVYVVRLTTASGAGAVTHVDRTVVRVGR
ncbi:MAG: T9SS type A sorting domain-containing protein [Bacteroidota bacterium]